MKSIKVKNFTISQDGIVPLLKDSIGKYYIKILNFNEDDDTFDIKIIDEYGQTITLDLYLKELHAGPCSTHYDKWIVTSNLVKIVGDNDE